MASCNKNLEDLIRCTICLNIFCKPKALPCLHTFCLHCLQTYVDKNELQKTLLCILCKEKTSIPDDGVQGLKNNFYISNLVLALSQDKKEEEPQEIPQKDDQLSLNCQLCDGLGDLNNFCSICDLWMCSNCSNGHTKIPATANHVITSNSEMDRQCKEIAEEKSAILRELKMTVKEKNEDFSVRFDEVEENHRVKEKNIKSTANKLRRLINHKERVLLEKLQAMKSVKEVYEDKISSLMYEMDQVNVHIKDIDKSCNGHKSRHLLNTVVESLDSNMKTWQELSSSDDGLFQVKFDACQNSLTCVQNLEIGRVEREIQLLIVKETCEIPVNIFVNSSVGVLKTKLQAKTGLHPLQQKLVLDDLTLCDHQNLSELDIQHGCRNIKLMEITGVSVFGCVADIKPVTTLYKSSLTSCLQGN